jgi:Zn-dependent peptidase ImmA (M78 family)
MELTIDSVLRLDNADEIARYARNALRNAGALGTLPTPIDDLLAAAKVGSLRIEEDTKDRFLAGLRGSARTAFKSMFQKVRGVADLRERVVYVDEALSDPRILFTKGHELGHEVLPWQKLDPALFDDGKSLSCDAEEDFDIEANLFAAEVIFQGDRFSKIVRDYAPGFETIFHVAKLHGASRHATSWRYVEAQDESVALIIYLPCKYQIQTLWRSKVVVSSSFRRRYCSIAVPQRLASDHAWAAAWHSNLIHCDTISLDCDGASHAFEWQAWWNRHAVFVMLRHKPVLHFLRDIKEKVSILSR